MSLPYQYSPYIWPMLASAALLLGLGVYCLRRRTAPGAKALAAMELCLAAWAIGAALELAAVDLATKIMWVKYQAVFMLPIPTTGLWFALDYAGLSRLLPRRGLALLALPPILALIITLANDPYQMIWRGFDYAGYVRPLHGSLYFLFTIYGYLLGVASFLTLLWLFVRSPLHRIPVALMLCGMMAARGMYLLELTNRNPFAPMDPNIVVQMLTSGFYALAVFRFHMLELIPLARSTVIEHMQEGMLVLDPQRKVVDMNPACERILSRSLSGARGQPASSIFPALYAPSGEVLPEIITGKGSAAHYFALSTSSITGRSGEPLGRLLLFHDKTQEKRAQAQLLEQQRAIATLEERQALARDLHDSVGQVLGYCSFQADAARKLYRDGQAETADRQLARLSAIAQDAHADVREYILNLRMGPSPQRPFIPDLRQYLASFSMQYGIQTALEVSDRVEKQGFEPEISLHLFRIVQEALSNARKHSAAHNIRVVLEQADGTTRLTIQDDGCGFDTGQTPAGGGFGLNFMQERAEKLGGSLDIQSTPGAGSHLTIEIPLKTGADP